MLSRTLFHPSVTAWFQHHFKSPTPAQAEAWPLIKAGRNVLIAAPTGSGKTLAAFMAAIDDLVRQGIAAGEVTFFSELDPAAEWQVRQALLRAAVRAPSLAPEMAATTDEQRVQTH
jgi:superfamily II DNA/RNA helicase